VHIHAIHPCDLICWIYDHNLNEICHLFLQ
jgi:hypothetical protein